MRRSKFILFIALSLLLFLGFGSGIRVRADIGPKPSVIVRITGLDDEKYTATLVAKNPTGPYYDYEEWLERGEGDYHPIMEYVDADGYKWVGMHWELEGNAEFSWSYHPPREFKIVLLMEDGTVYTSQVLKRYAFRSYFETDLRKAEEAGEVWLLDVEKNYPYWVEMLSFFLRLAATLLIEMGLLFLFGYRLKKSIKLVLLMNLLTQVALNVALNIADYFEGFLVGLILLVLLEFLVVVVETICYGFFLREKEAWRAVIFGIVANLASFGIGALLYLAV